MGQPYKRRIYLVDKTFQLKFVGLFIGIMSMLTILIGVVLYQVLNGIIEKQLYSTHISVVSSGELLRPALFWVNFTFMGVLILVSVVYVFVHLRRVSGSLRRFANHLAGMRGRMIPKTIYFRQNDPLHRVAEDFNLMSAHLEKKIMATENSLHRATDTLHELRISQAVDSKTACEKLKEIQNHLLAAEKEVVSP
jgi:methyl-accepting chemotaxis protein